MEKIKEIGKSENRKIKYRNSKKIETRKIAGEVFCLKSNKNWLIFVKTILLKTDLVENDSVENRSC